MFLTFFENNVFLVKNKFCSIITERGLGAVCLLLSFRILHFRIHKGKLPSLIREAGVKRYLKTQCITCLLKTVWDLILPSYLLTARSIQGNICSEVQGVWTESSENKYFPCGLRSQFIRFLLQMYSNKQVKDETLLCLSIVRSIR